jgi:hypothetical protein
MPSGSWLPLAKKLENASNAKLRPAAAWRFVTGVCQTEVARQLTVSAWP